MSRRSRRATTVCSTLASNALERQETPDEQAAAPPAAVQGLAPLTEMVGSCAAALGLTVRTATLADVHNITQAHMRFEMEMATWSPDGDSIPDGLNEGIRTIINEEGGDRIVLLTRELADCGGGASEVIGFVYSCDEVENDSDAPSCYIAEVFVEPSERGNGLGELLVSAALCSAMGRGTSASHLYVCHRNTTAVRLYKKLGFAEDGESGDPTHDLMMSNGALTPASVLQRLAERQNRQPAARRTGRRKRGGNPAGAAPAAEPQAASRSKHKFAVGETVSVTKGKYKGDHGIVLRHEGSATVFRFQVHGKWEEDREWSYSPQMIDHDGLVKVAQQPRSSGPSSRAQRAQARARAQGSKAKPQAAAAPAPAPASRRPKRPFGTP